MEDIECIICGKKFSTIVRGANLCDECYLNEELKCPTAAELNEEMWL